MKILTIGSRGPEVELLQLALNRAGRALAVDGIFGEETHGALMSFQREHGLHASGVADAATQRALLPWYTGFLLRTVRAGDTLFRFSVEYGTTVRAIETANPGIDPMRLQIGQIVVVPLGFPVVPSTISYSSALISYVVRGLAARYPFLRVGEIGRSVLGKPLLYLGFGVGENRVLYNAAHHANEWITTPLLLKFAEELASAYATGGSVYGVPAGELYERANIYLVPAVNPDGIDLVTGVLTSGTAFNSAWCMAQSYPDIPFPSGWKANIRGVDLNLQYPAGWDQAREIKFAQGFTSPGPRDFVGDSPLSAPESLAMYRFTLELSPALTLSYHTQGKVIYWKFLNFDPPGAAAIAERFALSSGYELETTPFASGFAGYKDWYIQDFNRPGFTIEAGLGENPLPLSQFPEIYADNLGILTLGALLTSDA